ncbi:MAG: hypothetical protein KGL39_11225 [Patescibacteria group bacterium]|nr:hypothetical protein [Patescibacteria group bacterium]
MKMIRFISALLLFAFASTAMASGFSDFERNKITDWLFRGQTVTPPSTLYVALITANKGTWAALTVYSTGDEVVTGSPTNGHLYKATTGGTSGSSAPAWATAEGGTVTDGTVTWTEQSLALNAGTFTEASYTGYARASIAASLTDFAGTQGTGTTTASSGTSGETSNNTTITFGAPTSNQTGLVVGIALMDALTAGNEITWAIMTTPVQILSGASAPSVPAANWTFTQAP